MACWRMSNGVDEIFKARVYMHQDCISNGRQPSTGCGNLTSLAVVGVRCGMSFVSSQSANSHVRPPKWTVADGTEVLICKKRYCQYCYSFRALKKLTWVVIVSDGHMCEKPGHKVA